jgi:hypothetical protein
MHDDDLQQGVAINKFNDFLERKKKLLKIRLPLRERLAGYGKYRKLL